MKEATGNLNATVIVVVAVGVLSAFFFSVIWPKMQANNVRNMKCGEAICGNSPDADGMVQCIYEGVNLTCPYKG